MVFHSLPIHRYYAFLHGCKYSYKNAVWPVMSIRRSAFSFLAAIKLIRIKFGGLLLYPETLQFKSYQKAPLVFLRVPLILSFQSSILVSVSKFFNSPNPSFFLAVCIDAWCSSSPSPYLFKICLRLSRLLHGVLVNG